VNFIGAEVVAGQPLAMFYSPMLLAGEREYVALLQVPDGAPTPALGGERARVLDAARQRLKRLGLTDSQIEKLPQKSPDEMHTEILAPMSGTVVARQVYEGQYVKEGDKLFEIADFSTMWFQFDAYERDLIWLKTGQKVQVTTSATPGQIFHGAIAFIEPSLKEMTRSAKVRVELPNPILTENGRQRRALYHKLYADAVVQVDVPETLAVPRAAVLSPGPQPMVYVERSSGVYEQRQVKLGRAGDDYWEVLDGLSEDEQVVSTGNLLIDAQAQINHSVQQSSRAPGFPPSSPEKARFTAVQQKALTAFLAAAGAVAEALASDNLAEFNRQATNVHAAIPALLEVFDQQQSWQPLVANIEGTGHLEKAGDLAAARKAFLAFSFAVSEFAARLRQQSEFGYLKIYQCPMVNRAVPGAPRVGRWVQAQSPLRNPYFGAEMLDCGNEVKP
jgi:Cu(I)/Ag(I) efflux system membrane fusion protein